MRKYHRWLATIAGIFILWTALTGVVTQASRLYASSEPRPAQAAPAAPTAPEAPRPPQSPARQFVHFVTDLHSGESFGLIGQLVSLVTGLALLFLAGSGLFMYIQMFRARGRKARPGQPRWFWQ